MNQHRDLIVRQHARAEVRLQAEFCVDTEHQSQVRLAGGCDAAKDAQTLEFRIVDLGAGGAGGRTSVFLPRMVKGHLRIFDSSNDGGSPTVLFEHEVRVRRCEMLDPEPTYLLGFSFENAGPDLVERISAALEKVTLISPPADPPDRDASGGKISA